MMGIDDKTVNGRRILNEECRFSVGPSCDDPPFDVPKDLNSRKSGCFHFGRSYL